MPRFLRRSERLERKASLASATDSANFVAVEPCVLLNLPDEVLLEIVKLLAPPRNHFPIHTFHSKEIPTHNYLSARSDVRSVVMTCSRLYRVTTPFMYMTVKILESRDLFLLIRTLFENRRRRYDIRDLSIEAGLDRQRLESFATEFILTCQTAEVSVDGPEDSELFKLVTKEIRRAARSKRLNQNHGMRLSAYMFAALLCMTAKLQTLRLWTSPLYKQEVAPTHSCESTCGVLQLGAALDHIVKMPGHCGRLMPELRSLYYDSEDSLSFYYLRSPTRPVWIPTFCRLCPSIDFIGTRDHTLHWRDLAAETPSPITGVETIYAKDVASVTDLTLGCKAIFPNLAKLVVKTESARLDPRETYTQYLVGLSGTLEHLHLELTRDTADYPSEILQLAALPSLTKLRHLFIELDMLCMLYHARSSPWSTWRGKPSGVPPSLRMAEYLPSSVQTLELRCLSLDMIIEDRPTTSEIIETHFSQMTTLLLQLAKDSPQKLPKLTRIVLHFTICSFIRRSDYERHAEASEVTREMMQNGIVLSLIGE